MNPESLHYQLLRMENWVKSADTKIGVLLTFEGVVLLYVVNHFVTRVFNSDASIIFILGYCVVLVLFIWSIIKSLHGIIPRLKHHQGAKSPLYFNDISSMSLKDYEKLVAATTPKKYKQELTKQIHTLSLIASQKMRDFRDAVGLLFVSLMVMGALELWHQLMSLHLK